MELRNPHYWYPRARSLRRRIIAHLGPTNSGKTHGAVEAVLSARYGIYCGPLRLLAQEQWEKMRGRVKCGLRTGDVIRSPIASDIDKVQSHKDAWREGGATHLACTVEMADFEGEYDVGVIDEVQMMTDPDRGWAFTQALLGLPCRELYVCGEPAIEPLLTKLCKIMNEELRIRKFDRLSPLGLEKRSVWLKELEGGDAAIAFSRRDIFHLQREICELTGKNAAVVYGGLPLEHRAEQADAFNTAKLPILVASDAIGMGMNLNIGRILFSALRKQSNEGFERVPEASIRQIAGRAGRFGTERGGAGGQVGLLAEGEIFPGDYGYLRSAMYGKPKAYHGAGLLPNDQMLLDAAARHILPEVLSSKFALDSIYFPCSTMNLLENLALIEEITDKLNPSELLTLARAPVKHRQPLCQSVFRSLSQHIAACRPPTQLIDLPSLSKRGSVMMRLETAEHLHQALELYRWMALRFPHSLAYNHPVIEGLRVDCSKTITDILESLGRRAKRL